MKRVLVIGGAGYIGSHMVLKLKEAGLNPVVFDNLLTGHKKQIPAGAVFVKGDLRNKKDIKTVLSRFRYDGVMHFAASSLAGESVEKPLAYYENNVSAFVNLLEAMKEKELKTLIFSSSCAVYGNAKKVPIDESCPANPESPYGRSKWMMEKILEDAARVYPFRYAMLRYFNVAGADPECRTGENHHPETHLIPKVLKSLQGEKPVTVFGEDYPTPDGTCVRDYLHVNDVADAHLKALRFLWKKGANGAFNLGTGHGYSVLDIIRMVEKVTGREVRRHKGPRREGDPAKLVASFKKARVLLGWKPCYDLKDMILTAWRWHQNSKA